MTTDFELMEYEIPLMFIFEGNEIYVVRWLIGPNSHLGGISPLELIERNCGHKVMQFIHSAFEENR